VELRALDRHLRRLVEVLSVSASTVPRCHVFGPLDMTDTGFAVPEDSLDRFAACYQYRPRHAASKTIPRTALRSPALLSVGRGGLVSSTADYVRFCGCSWEAASSTDAGSSGERPRAHDGEPPAGGGQLADFATGASASRNSPASGSVSGLPSDSAGRYRQCRFGGEYYWAGRPARRSGSTPSRTRRRLHDPAAAVELLPFARNSAPSSTRRWRTDPVLPRGAEEQELAGESDLACV